MKLNKKLITVTACTALALTIGGSIYANEISKKDKLENQKIEEKAEKDKLESMSNQTVEEIEMTVEQGRKVKEIGLAVGKLEEEVNPVDPRVKLEEDIQSLKGVMDTKGYYKTMVDDPKHGSAYAKAVEILEKKKQTLAQIEVDLKENNKSVEQLAKEFDQLLKEKELIIQ